MAATDSTLKTVQIIGETQRQNQIDIFNAFQSSINAANESTKFKADISNAMVSTALNYKKQRMDEYFKSEGLKLEAKRLALQEKRDENSLMLRRRELKIRENEEINKANILKEREKRDEEDDKYKQASSLIESKFREVQDRESFIDSQIDSIDLEIKNILSTPPDKISESDKRKAISEKRAEIIRLQKQKLDLSSQVSTIRRHQESVYTRSMSPGDIIKSLQLPSGNNSQSSVANGVNTFIGNYEDTGFRFYQNTPNVDYVPQKEESTFSEMDYFNVFGMTDAQGYNPETLKSVFSQIPEKKQNNLIRKLEESFSEDAAALASGISGYKIDTDYSKHSEGTGKDFNKIQLFSQRVKSAVIAENKDKYQSASEIPFDTYLEKAREMRGISQSIEEEKQKREGESAADSFFSSGGNTQTLQQEQSRKTEIEELLGLRSPESISELIASGEFDNRKKDADTLYQYESQKRSISENAKKDILYLARELSGLSVEQLGLDPFAYTDIGGIGSEEDDKKKRIQYLLQNPNEAIDYIIASKMNLSSYDLKRINYISFSGKIKKEANDIYAKETKRLGK